jgi:CHAD domain-containing protein
MSSRPEEVGYDLARFAADAIDDRARVLGARLKSARATLEPEAVHQARVASRRLREALALAALADPARAEKAARGARRITRALSPLRTGDSLALTLVAAPLPAAAEEGRRRLLKHLERRRAKRLHDAARALAAPAAKKLVKRARQAAGRLGDAASPEVEKNRARFLALASEFVGARLRALDEHVAPLPPDPRPEDLHRGRILIKKLRYAWELLRPALPQERFGPIRQRLEAAQETGGRYHDLELLRELAEARRLREKDGARAAALAALEQALAAPIEEARRAFLTALLPLGGEEFRAALFSVLDPGGPTNGQVTTGNRQ